MIDQRQAVKELYTNPTFKSKFWEDTEVFNENTPLLKENIEECLKKFTNYCDVYDSFYDYQKNCQTKNYPQVVGLKGESMDHWIAVLYEEDKYKFIDSSGCPVDVYYINGIPDLPAKHQVIATEAGFIRQSPKANSCGLYALFFCIGFEIDHDGFEYWSRLAPRTIAYTPITVTGFYDAYAKTDIGYFLYNNDINMYNFYMQINR